MRRLAALLLAGALALTLCACGGEPVPTGGEPEASPSQTPAKAKEFSLAYDPNASLHPVTGDSQVNLTLAPLVFEGLYRLDEQFRPRPVLARSAEGDDSGLVWTVTVDEGAKFSDGTPLTAAPVAASLNQARNSSLYGGRLSQVASVRAVEGAVVITLTAPNGALPALLDIPVALEGENGLPLGTGRYRYAREGEELSLAANEYHSGALPYDSIPLYPVTTAEERVAAFDSGAVTAVVTEPASAYGLGYSCSYEGWDYATPRLLYVGFRANGGPCASPEVRRAFSRAFDRATVVKTLLAGHADGTALPISPLHEEYDDGAAAELSYDMTAAAEALARAGYVRKEDGLLYSGRTALAVTLLVNSDNTARTAIADLLAASLEELGVTVTVSKLPWRDYLAALKAGKFDLYLGGTQLTGEFDLTELLTGSLNYGGYASADLSAALAAWKGAAGEARIQAAKDLWDAFVREAPVAPLCFKRESLLVRWSVVDGLDPIWGDPFHGMEGWQPVME